jgi:hypothetical protein
MILHLESWDAASSGHPCAVEDAELTMLKRSEIYSSLLLHMHSTWTCHDNRHFVHDTVACATDGYNSEKVLQENNE